MPLKVEKEQGCCPNTVAREHDPPSHSMERNEGRFSRAAARRIRQDQGTDSGNSPEQEEPRFLSGLRSVDGVDLDDGDAGRFAHA